jgi:hypothetical protein
MSWSEDSDDLRSGASNSEEFEAVHGKFGEDGISQVRAARLADEIMADEKKHGTAREDKPTSKPGSRRNRHLDGFGGRNNA